MTFIIDDMEDFDDVSEEEMDDITDSLFNELSESGFAKEVSEDLDILDIDELSSLDDAIIEDDFDDSDMF